MFMSRLILPADASGAKARWRDLQDPYRSHQALWRLFSDDPTATRDFLYRREGAGRDTMFYMVSRRAPRQDSDVFKIQTRPYEPILQSGEELSFVLRVNPIVSRRDSEDRQHRHDVVMDLKRTTQGLPREQRPNEAELVQEAGIKWLASRSTSHGFSFGPNAVRVDTYTCHTIHKPGAREIHISTVDFTGTLRVDVVEPFVAMLKSGLGPAKGFGCGLMLVKRL